MPLAGPRPPDLEIPIKRDWTDSSTYPIDEDELIDAYKDHCPWQSRAYESAAQIFLGFGAKEGGVITINGHTTNERTHTITLTEDQVAVWFDLTRPRKEHLQWLGDELKRPKRNETQRQRGTRYANHHAARKPPLGLEADIIEFVDADRIQTADTNRKSIKDLLRELYEAHHLNQYHRGLTASPVAPRKRIRIQVPEYFGRRNRVAGVLFVFDLTKTLNPQWAKMKIRLANYQKQANVTAPDTRVRKATLLMFLRVLDARALTPPVPYPQICRVIKPEHLHNPWLRGWQLHKDAKKTLARLFR